MSKKHYWVLFYPLAVLLRSTNLLGVFVDGKVFLFSTDSYYHLRRVIATYYNFPHVPQFDKFVGFPQGTVIHWPFGFDIMMAGLMYIFTFGQADRWWIEALSAVAPPILGAVAPLIIYFIGKELADEYVGFFAALVASILPIAIHASQIGNFDHHFATTIFQSLFFLFYLRATKREGWLNIFASALFFALGFTLTTEFPGIAAIHSIFLLFALIRSEEREQILDLNLKIYALITVILTPFVFVRYFEPVEVSPLIGSAWFGFLMATTALTAVSCYKKKLPYIYAAILAVFIVASLWKFDFSNVYAFYAEMQFGQGENVLSTSTIENLPLYSRQISDIFWLVSGFFLLTPLILWRLIQSRKSVELAIGFYLLLAQLGTIERVRFSVLLVMPLAVGSGLIARRIKKTLEEKWPDNYKVKLAFYLSISLLLLPCFTYTSITKEVVGSKTDFFSLYKCFLWLKENSPKVEASNPSYGVLANDWQIAHWLNYYAERPTVASPLWGFEAVYKDVVTTAKLFTKTEAEVAAEMRAKKLNYLLLNHFQGNFSQTLALAGYDTEKLSQQEMFNIFYNSVYGRLLLTYSLQPTTGSEGMEHLRLVYESQEQIGSAENPFPACLLFEFVEGASIRALTKPQALVRVKMEITTNTGRKLSYSRQAVANANGEAIITVPYSTGTAKSSAVVASPCRIESEGVLRSFAIPDDLVKSGATIELKF